MIFLNSRHLESSPLVWSTIPLNPDLDKISSSREASPCPWPEGDKTLCRPGDQSRSSGGCGAVKTWSWFPGPGVTVARLSWWRDQFLSAGRAVLKKRPQDGRDLEIMRLRRPPLPLVDALILRAGFPSEIG